MNKEPELGMNKIQAWYIKKNTQYERTGILD